MPDIDFQKIELNLIPKKGDEPVIFYASQYETARPFIADLKWGDSEFAPGDDCWAEIDIRKNDDNLVVITDDVSIDNNEVSVILPVQALTCIGKNLGQVKIYAADDHLVCALNFILEVQADPLAGGVTSETAIDNLTEQIEEITQQVIGDDYYNKTEVDGLLAGKADQATTYTKSEVDTALNLKADKATTYTKTQVDSALALKADKSDTYTKTQVDNALALKANTADLATVATTGDYDDLINKPSIPAAQVQSDYAQADNTQVDYIKNKPDINAMIANALLAVMPVDSATGDPAIFDTEIAAPLVNVSCDIVASGGGTPDSPVPIVGYSQANITANGDTVTIAFGDTYYGGVLDVTRGKLHVTWGHSDMGDLSYTKYDVSEGTLFRARIDEAYLPANSLNIKSSIYLTTTSNNRVNYTISVGSAGRIDFINNDYSDKDVFKSAMAGIYVYYELATPFDIDLTPEVISAIVGVNNVYSDTNGDTTVQYKDSIQHYIDQRT